MREEVKAWGKLRPKMYYGEAVEADSITPVDTIEAIVLVAMAVYIGKIRRIGNFVYEA